jgi:hypothetical protein
MEAGQVTCDCGADFPSSLGKYGCPNCGGDGTVALLRDAIHASGMSARRFAEDVLVRDERTIRRWLNGHSPMPTSVIRWLKKPRE